MRVKVTYTVDSEEVLAEVKRLINSKLMSVKPALDVTAAYDFEKSPLKDSLEIVDQLRKQLFDLDTILLDAHGILRSYAQASFTQGEESE